MAKAKKTQSMRMLESAGVSYDVIDLPGRINDATEVANFVEETPDYVYKTLVVVRPQGKPLLVMIASNRTLDLKMLAKAVGEKKLHMAKHAEAEQLTGLQVGGISALALINKGFEVYIDQPALDLPHVLVSAGKRGMNLRVPVEGLMSVTGAQAVEATGPLES